MSYQQAILLDARGNVVRAAHPSLPSFPATTASTITAAAVSLTVADNQGFTNGDYVLLGQPQQQKTELVTIGAVVTRGTALTISAAVFDHPQDTVVQLTLWNQVELSGAATVTGSKTVITTTNIQYAMPFTEYVVSGTTYAYYFVRYKNSATGAFSSYSDAAPAAGYDADTVAAVKTTALNLTGEKIDAIITDDFLNTEITNCEIDIWKQKRRWAQFYIDSYVIGTLTSGVVDYAMPTNISDNSTNSAIRAVRVRQIGMLEYIDVEAIEGLLWDTAQTTLAVTVNAGDTTATLTSAADFSDGSGSVLIGSDTVYYTDIDYATNIISGIPASGDGSFTQTWPATTTYVWQGGNVEISPTVYTVKPGYVSLVLPPSQTYTGQAIYLSYYSKPSYPGSDADLVEWPDPELYHFFLAWKIDMRRHNGTPTETGLNFKNLYDERRTLLLSRARLQDTPKFMPERRFGRQELGKLPDDLLCSWIIR